MHKTAKLEVRTKKSGKGVFSLCSFKKGELILEFEKSFVKKPTNYSLRISANKHQLSKDPGKLENFVNHSCRPSAFIDFNGLRLIALRNIKIGDEITYNYLTVDWDDEDVFICHCGTTGCLNKIQGFKRLSLKDKLKLRKYLSPFLREKLKKELSSSKHKKE